MSLKKTNDTKGYMRGAGAYSRDYQKFDGERGNAGWPSKPIWQKVEGTGDYDGEFTGKVSSAPKGDVYGTSQKRFPRYSDSYTDRGDGKYSPTRDGARAAKGAGLKNNRGFQGEKGKYGGGYDEGY